MATKFCFVRSPMVRVELLLTAHFGAAYSSDAIYLYSTRDDPEPTSIASRESSILPPNKRRKHRQDSPGSGSIATTPHNELTEEEADRDAMMEEDIERISAESSPSPSRERLDDLMNVDDEDDRPEDGDEEEEYEEDEESQGDQRYKEVPIIMPRSRYDGVCNVETVKDGKCHLHLPVSLPPDTLR